MSVTTSPLVSCLMVTKPDRQAFLARSLAAYCGQSHHPCELVIVVHPSARAAVESIERLIADLGRTDIRLVSVSGEATLGALRNRSIREARGDVVCQWDDDDLHHPERVARQLGALRQSGRRSCFLQDSYQYIASRREIYWTNWAMTPGQAFPGSLMAERRLELFYPETGPTAAMGEDTVVLAGLREADEVYMLAGQPHLFVYVTHGANTWPVSHHDMLASRLSLSRALLVRREAQVRAGLRGFDFGPDPVTVMGSNGPAFVLARES